MAHVVKDNRCFADAYAPKYKGSRTYTVVAGDSQLFTFYDDSITASDVCAVSVAYADGRTIDEITTTHVIANGGLQVKAMNSGATDATVTVNVVVL